MSSRKRGALFFFFAVGLLATGLARADRQPQNPQPTAAQLPRYESRRVSVSEYRASLLGLIEDMERNQVRDADRDAIILKLVGSYRMRGLPNSTSISNESFIKVLVSEVLKKFPRPCAPEDFGERDRLRDQLRRGVGPAVDPVLAKRLDELERCSAELERTRAAETTDVAYSVLLDRALSVYAELKKDDHSEAAELLRSFGNKLGKCVARRIVALGDAVRKGKETQDPDAPKCELDDSERLPEKPNFNQKIRLVASIGFARLLGCPLHIAIPDDCTLRKKIYDLAKPQLMQLRTDPRVLAIENQEFNSQVRKQFLAQLNVRAASYNDDLVAKFGGTMNELLTPKAPLIERNEGSSESFSMKDLAEGLYADVAAATALHRSKDPLHRGAAGALLYAAANRAIFFVGGARSKIGPEGWKVVGAFDPNDPGKIPVFETEPFGGIGMGLVDGHPKFSAWDLDNYAPASGGALRLFPSLFALTASGEAKADPAAQSGPRGHFENLRDMGMLLDALVYFLKVTGPKGELGKYFVPQDDFATLLGDRNSPALFPKEGRALIYGLAAAVLQNAVAIRKGVDSRGQEVSISIGHLEEGSAGLKYHDIISLDEADPRFKEPATTLGVAKLLLAAKNFRSIVDPQHLDSEFPKSLLQYLPKVDNALLFGHIQLAAQNPCQDGGFGSRIEGPCAGNAAGGGRTLQDTVAALRTITLIYNDIEQEAVLIKIRQAWRFLDQFWQGTGSALPLEVLGLRPQPVQPSRMWQVLALWNDTQIKVTHSSISREIPWDVWRARFETLRQRMLGQLQGPDGPEPLVP